MSNATTHTAAAPAAGVGGSTSDRAAARPMVTSRTLVLAALAAGVLLRVLQYAVNRALWLDEAALAVSLNQRSFAGLLEPLRYGQTAPLGFLWAERAVIELLGSGEMALRLVPFAAGIAALLLFPALARRVLSPGAVPLAVALLALSPFLIYYTSELKQYSLDVLVTVTVLWLAASTIADGLTRRRALALLASGAVGVWLSQPAAFVLGGAGLTLGARALARRDRRELAWLAGVGAAWGASFVVSYALVSRLLPDPEYMQAFWRSGFAPRSAAALAWLPLRLVAAFRDPFGIPDDTHRAEAWVHPLAGIAAFALGCLWLYRRRRAYLPLVALPPLLVLTAAALRLYPLGGAFTNGGRVLLFLLPCVFLAVAEGAEAVRAGLWARGKTAKRAAALAGAALMVVLAWPYAAYAALGVPQVREEMPPLLAHAREHWRPGDVIYVYYAGLPAFEYYFPRTGFRPADVVPGACARPAPLGYLADLAKLEGRPRAWVLFAGATGAKGFDEKGLMLGYLDHVGRRLDAQSSVGASLYLYDLSRPFAAAGGFSARVPPPSGDVADECRGTWKP